MRGGVGRGGVVRKVAGERMRGAGGGGVVGCGGCRGDKGRGGGLSAGADLKPLAGIMRVCAE